MAYSEAVLHRARERLLQEKNLYEAETAARRAQVLQAYPRLREIDQALRQSVAGAECTVTVHRQLLDAGVLLLEGLDLSGVEEGTYFLIAAPLKIAGADGSPVRAMLLERQ